MNTHTLLIRSPKGYASPYAVIMAIVPVLLIGYMILNYQSIERHAGQDDAVRSQKLAILQLNNYSDYYIRARGLRAGDPLTLDELVEANPDIMLRVRNQRAWIADNGSVILVSSKVPDKGEPLAVIYYYDANRQRAWYPIKPSAKWKGLHGLGFADLLHL